MVGLIDIFHLVTLQVLRYQWLAFDDKIIFNDLFKTARYNSFSLQVFITIYIYVYK